MFRVLVSRRKRRVWSTGTIAASLLTHLILFGGALSVTTGTPAPREVKPDSTITWVTNDKLPEPDPVDPPPPPPTPSDDYDATTGETLLPKVADKVPDGIPPADVDDTPVRPEDYTGLGRPGDVIGPPATDPTPPTGGGGEEVGCGLGEDDVCEPSMVEERPAYRDPGEAARTLRRAYPAILAQAGTTGHTEVRLGIDREGKVVPGSVQVVSTTHQAFAEAAMKAMEKIRFSPARINGLPVSVSITMTVEWKLER